MPGGQYTEQHVDKVVENMGKKEGFTRHDTEIWADKRERVIEDLARRGLYTRRTFTEADIDAQVNRDLPLPKEVNTSAEPVDIEAQKKLRKARKIWLIVAYSDNNLYVDAEGRVLDDFGEALSEEELNQYLSAIPDTPPPSPPRPKTPDQYPASPVPPEVLDPRWTSDGIGCSPKKPQATSTPLSDQEPQQPSTTLYEQAARQCHGGHESDSGFESSSQSTDDERRQVPLTEYKQNPNGPCAKRRRFWKKMSGSYCAVKANEFNKNGGKKSTKKCSKKDCKHDDVEANLT